MGERRWGGGGGEGCSRAFLLHKWKKNPDAAEETYR